MTAMRKQLKARKAYAGSHCLHRLVRWLRDVRDIPACKEILWSELDRDRDETESLRTLTTVAVNSLYWSRKEILQRTERITRMGQNAKDLPQA